MLAEFVWTDDSFLSLSVARNLALGNGMTADGTNVTNGFQPLYVWLMVPVYAIMPEDDLIGPIHVAGVMLALAGTAAAAIFYLIALRLFSRIAALMVLFFFTVSHYFVINDVNGLETALYGLTLSGTLYYYLTRFIQSDSSTRWQAVVLGVLGGLTVLARVDAVIFLVSVAGHFLWVRRRRIGPALKRAGVGTVAFLVTLAPWLVSNAVLCKRLTPVSGPAVRFIATQGGWSPTTNLVGYQGPERFVDLEVPWQFYGNSVLRLAVQAIAFFPPTAHAQGIGDSYLFNRVDRFPIGWLAARAPWAGLAALVLAIIALLVVPFHQPDGGKARRGLRAIAFLRFAVVGWFAAYALYVMCSWYSFRYLYPVLAILTLGSGAAVDIFIRLASQRARKLVPTALVVAVGAYTFVFYNHTEHYYYRAGRIPPLPDRITPVIPWIQENVPPDAVIACFQTGLLAYFLPNRCVNLDGVVNANALAASKSRTLWNYIESEGVDYVVDWPVCIQHNLIPFAGVDEVPLVYVHRGWGMHVYEVVGSSATGAREGLAPGAAAR